MRGGGPISVVVGLWMIAVGVAPIQVRGLSAQEGGGRAPARAEKNPSEGNKDAIRNGNAMFKTRCAGCHGPDAKGYVGPDLTGLWASGFTDGRIFDTVRNGVPGTEMPAAEPLRMPDKEIWQVLAYVRTLAGSTAAAPKGNPENGARLFQTTCSGCHLVAGRGGDLGPELTRVGSGRSRAVMAKKIRTPSDNIRVGYEPVTLVLRDGQRIRGVRKNEDEFSIQIMDLRQRVQGFLKTNLTEVTEEKQSVMPAFGSDKMSDENLDDLLSYLATLRGPESVRR